MIFALAVTLAATMPTELPASQALAENRLALQLWSDDRIRTIYVPYFDCYWTNVKDEPDSNLKSLELGEKMFARAYYACTGERQLVDHKADQYLTPRQDYTNADVRADTIPRYRRQVGIIILLQHYHDVGKSDLINNYMAKSGRRSRKQ